MREPVVLLDQLEAGLGRVEALPGDDAEGEGDQRRPQRDPARVVERRLAFAAQDEDQQRADQRQDQQAGKDPRAGHQRIPPNRYQVAMSATPISIAKA